MTPNSKKLVTIVTATNINCSPVRSPTRLRPTGDFSVAVDNNRVIFGRNCRRQEEAIIMGAGGSKPEASAGSKHIFARYVNYLVVE